MRNQIAPLAVFLSILLILTACGDYRKFRPTDHPEKGTLEFGTPITPDGDCGSPSEIRLLALTRDMATIELQGECERRTTASSVQIKAGTPTRLPMGTWCTLYQKASGHHEKCAERSGVFIFKAETQIVHWQMEPIQVP